MSYKDDQRKTNQGQVSLKLSEKENKTWNNISDGEATREQIHPGNRSKRQPTNSKLKLEDINTKYEKICKMSLRMWCYERTTRSEIRNMQN